MTKLRARAPRSRADKLAPLWNLSPTAEKATNCDDRCNYCLRTLLAKYISALPLGMVDKTNAEKRRLSKVLGGVRRTAGVPWRW